MLPKVYIGKRKENVSHIPLLYSNLGLVNKPDRLFLNQALHAGTKKIVEIVESPEEADFIVLPHEYFAVSHDQEYIEYYKRVSKEVGKKLIIFDYSDLDKDIPLKDAIVCRTSQYGYKKRNNEIIIPPVVEDLGLKYGVDKRDLKHLSISFCGWAKYSSPLRRVLTEVRDAAKGNLGPRKKGLLFRSKVIKILEGISSIRKNFIVRSFFSGHKSTIKEDPIKLREEYVQNMKDSDLALCVKGDGNFSIRFYEALSLGRVPLFIDTDCVLPLEMEGLLDYSKFMFRVNWVDIDKLPELVSNLLATMNQEKYLKMQELSRAAFENHLKQDNFLELLFLKILNIK